MYLACALRERGHWNCIACKKSSPLDKAATEADFERIYLPYIAEWDPVSAAILRFQTILRMRRNSGEQVILHAHTAHGASIAWLAALGGLCPRVVHRRVDFPLSNSASIKAKYASAGAVIAISDSIRRLLIDSGIPAEKIFKIHSSLPSKGYPWEKTGLAEYKKQSRSALAGSLGIPEDSQWIGSLIAFVPHKDPENLVLSAKYVQQKFPNTHFIIGGDGPLREKAKAKAESLNASGYIHFPGFINDPLSLLAALDIFVLPSWGEGMGSVLLEAMSAGTAIVATKAGGIPEVVEDGKSGLLSPPRNPEGLALAQCRILSDNNLKIRLAEAGLRRRENFTSENMARLTEEVYKHACSG